MRCCVLALLALAACGGDQVVSLELPDVDLDPAWLVLFDGDRPSDQLGPFSVHGGEIPEAERPGSALLLEADDGLYLAGLGPDEWASLRQRDLGFGALEVELEPSCDAGLGAQTEAGGALFIERVDTNPAARRPPGLDRWFLKAPAQTELCDPSRLEVTSFGPKEQLLEPGTEVLGAARHRNEGFDSSYIHLNDGVALGGDRLVAVSERVLFLFERGQPFDDRPTHRLASPEGTDWVSVVRRLPGTPERVLALAWRPVGAPRLLAHVVRVGPEGLTVEATHAHELAGRPVDFVVTPEGGLVLVTQARMNVYATSALSSPLEGGTLQALGPLDHLDLTSDPTDPLLLVGVGGAYRGRLEDGRFEVGRTLPMPEGLVRWLGYIGDLHVSGGDAWMGGRAMAMADPQPSPEILRLDAGDRWSRVPVEVSGRGSDCGDTDACGRIPLGGVHGLAELDVGGVPTLLIAYNECRTLIAAVPSAGCSFAFSLPSELRDAVPREDGSVLMIGKEGEAMVVRAR